MAFGHKIGDRGKTGENDRPALRTALLFPSSRMNGLSAGVPKHIHILLDGQSVPKKRGVSEGRPDGRAKDLLDLFCGAREHCRLRRRPSDIDADPPDYALDEGNRLHANAELPDTQPDKGERHPWLRCHLAADTNVQARRRASLHGATNEPEDRRMQW